MDMRLNPNQELTAADIVNKSSVEELIRCIATFGEEPQARRIAMAIIRRRPIGTALELAQVIEKAVPRRGRRLHPATRTFQALRIYVNDELGELDRGLHAAERLLAPGGRLAVVSFHSLEDRVVKTFLRARSAGGSGGSRHRPESAAPHDPTFLPLFRGTCRPSRAECEGNPRARSARLRAAERTAAAARMEGVTE